MTSLTAGPSGVEAVLLLGPSLKRAGGYSGIAEIVTDRALLQEIWDVNPLLRQYLGSLDNPELVLYRIQPTRVRFMQEWALKYHEVQLVE